MSLLLSEELAESLLGVVDVAEVASRWTNGSAGFLGDGTVAEVSVHVEDAPVRAQDDVHGISLATVKRELRSARAWLGLQLRAEPLL